MTCFPYGGPPLRNSDDMGLPSVGPEMPQKTDPYDMRTPSGRLPIMVSLSVWKALPDNRWYAVSRPLPYSV